MAHDPRGGSVEQTLTTLRQPSAGFELIDAETDADVRRIAGVLARADRLGATAGSGGFATALATLMARAGRVTRATPPTGARVPVHVPGPDPVPVVPSTAAGP